MEKQLIIGFLLAFLNVQFVAAQNTEMADKLRADGKIYVVLAVILLILFGLFAYLFSIDKKTKKLEDILKNNSTK